MIKKFILDDSFFFHKSDDSVFFSQIGVVFIACFLKKLRFCIHKNFSLHSFKVDVLFEVSFGYFDVITVL